MSGEFYSVYYMFQFGCISVWAVDSCLLYVLVCMYIGMGGGFLFIICFSLYVYRYGRWIHVYYMFQFVCISVWAVDSCLLYVLVCMYIGMGGGFLFIICFSLYVYRYGRWIHVYYMFQFGCISVWALDSCYYIFQFGCISVWALDSCYYIFQFGCISVWAVDSCLLYVLVCMYIGMGGGFLFIICFSLYVYRYGRWIHIYYMFQFGCISVWAVDSCLSFYR